MRLMSISFPKWLTMTVGGVSVLPLIHAEENRKLFTTLTEGWLIVWSIYHFNNLSINLSTGYMNKLCQVSSISFHQNRLLNANHWCLLTRWMGGGMDRGMDGGICEWIDGWMDGRMDGWTHGWMTSWRDGWMGGWMGRWVSGWMNLWTDCGSIDW